MSHFGPAPAAVPVPLPHRSRRHRAAPLIAAVLLAGFGCTRAGGADGPGGAEDFRDRGPADEIRIGYLPHLTHAGALVGVREGFFQEELGDTTLRTQTFDAGPDAVNALFGDSLDVAFVGPGPAVTAHQRSGGLHTRLIAGATSGGTQLVVRQGIDSTADLRGTTIATPQLANTQDIALKAWLADNGLPVGTDPDQVTVVNTAPPQALAAFRDGQVDGGWLPEPWASRLVVEAGAHVLVDERELWGGGQFPSTVLVARTRYLQEHPRTIEALLRGLITATDWIRAHPVDAQSAVNDELDELAGARLEQPVLDRAFGNLEFTVDPLAAAFPELSRDAVTAGVFDTAPELRGLVDLRVLNRVRTGRGQPLVGDAGLTGP